MKKEGRKISYDLLWEIQKIQKEKNLPTFDCALRYILQEYEREVKQNENKHKI